MREDIAAVNVTRTYTLAASNIAIFTFMLFFLFPKFESGRINPVLFQATLIAMGVATFSLVFATLYQVSRRRTVRRVTILLNSRSHSTELATAAQRSQSPKLKLAVENACCKNGT